MFDKEKVKRILRNTKIPANEYNILKDKKNLPVLKINQNNCSYYMSSKYDSEKEAEKFAEENYSEADSIFVYGLGMGYHIKALSGLLKENQCLYIAESNKNIVKAAFENTEILKTLEKNNVIFSIFENIEEAIVTMQNFLLKSSKKVILHEPSIRAIPKELEQIKDIFETFLIKRRSEKIMERTLFENELENLKKGYKNGGKIFKDKFKGKPAIIVSAGPSLEINGENLKYIKDKAIIISVGRALKYLYSIKIKPNFAIITDAKENVLNQLNFDETEIPLFFLSTIHPNIEKYKGPKYILFEEHSNKITEQEREFSVKAGGSVATTAISLAYLMGCNPLILIGQDLCYHSNKMHSGENTGFVLSKTYKKVKGIDGKEYSSPPNLYEYLKWFRKFAQSHKDREFINCTAKGAYIEGFSHKKIEEIF